MHDCTALATEVRHEVPLHATRSSPACGGRTRRYLVCAPTATSGFLLGICLFLPVGMYRGCGNQPPRAVFPHERQLEAIKSGDYATLLIISTPYVFGPAIGLGTLSVCWLGGAQSSRAHWTWYALLIAIYCACLVADVLVKELNSPGRNLADRWHEHGHLLLSVFWLLNVVLATWFEARSMFLAAMTLQGALVALIWLGLSQWLAFLDRLLIGGGLSALCGLLLAIGTVLQVFGDPSAARESLRLSRAGSAPMPTDGTPQFNLRSLLIATALSATLLAIGQVQGLSAALLCGFMATFAGLALRRLRCFFQNADARGRSIVLAAWYTSVAGAVLVGGFLAQ